MPGTFASDNTQTIHDLLRRLDPALWSTAQLDGETMLAVLARRDIGAVFRYLRQTGWSVPKISSVTRVPENQVRNIASGRQIVRTYDVLVRVAECLRIPRGAMGLAYSADDSTNLRTTTTLAWRVAVRTSTHRNRAQRQTVVVYSKETTESGVELRDQSCPTMIIRPMALERAHPRRSAH